MADYILEIVDPGLGATLQDQGRPGWRRFGVPVSGAMDSEAANRANAIVGNAAGAVVLELLLQGARIRILRPVVMAITGAYASCNARMDQPIPVPPGEVISFSRNVSGVWTYIAIAGGFQAEEILGSASVYARGGLGKALGPGSRLCGGGCPIESVTGNRVEANPARRDYRSPPAIRVWPAPQSVLFRGEAIRSFFDQYWTVSAQSDRVGYRLQGEPLPDAPPEIVSEPVLVGSIQVPPNGLPLVTMRDGPTVGGYPKLGVVDPEDLSWVAQSRPGTRIRFRAVAAWQESGGTGESSNGNQL